MGKKHRLHQLLNVKRFDFYIKYLLELDNKKRPSDEKEDDKSKATALNEKKKPGKP